MKMIIEKNKLHKDVRNSINDLLLSRSKRLNATAFSPAAGWLSGEGASTLMKLKSNEEKLVFIGVGTAVGVAAGAGAFKKYNKEVKKKTGNIELFLNKNMFVSNRIKESLLPKIQKGGYTHAYVNFEGNLVLTKEKNLFERIVQKLGVGRKRIPLQ